MTAVSAAARGTGEKDIVYADGTARINALLDASLNVLVPPGIYMITGELRVRNGHVVSATPGTVTLKTAAAYAGAIVSTYDQQITVRGVTFDGNFAERPSLEGNAGAALIRVTGASNVTFENNKFQYAPSFAFWTWRSALMQIRGNTFLECWHAIRMDGNYLQAGVIENNTFLNTAAFKSIQHIEAIGTVNLAIRGNTMSGAGLREPTSHGYEGTWGNSVYVWRSTGYTITNNTIGVNYWSSIVSGQDGTNGLIRGNRLSDGTVGGSAVWIEQPGSAYVTVDSNEIDGAVEIGDAGGDHCIVTNNIIRSRSYGLNLNSAAKDTLVQGNKIYSKAGYRYSQGVYLWQKTTPDVNTVLINNHIEGFDKGIAINNYGSTGTVFGITLSGNTFAGNNVNVWYPSGIVLNQPLGQ